MSALRWMAPLCLISVLWAFSFGANSALAPLWMQSAGCTQHLIGLNTGTYYLGIALASAIVPWAMRRFGWVALFVGVGASAFTAAAFPWGGGMTGWFVLRGVNGVVAAFSLIPLETYVNRNSCSERRATNFGFYAFCIALGMALGNLVAIQMAASRPHLAFLLAGAAAILGSVVVVMWRPCFPRDEEASVSRAPIRFGRDFLAFGSGWVQGFLEGGMVAHLPIYLLLVGLSHKVVSLLMAGLMIGVILAQAPLAWLADRLGRASVLAGCIAVSLAGVCCLLWAGGVAWLAVWLFAVGACSGALYPLGLAFLGERTRPEGLSRAGAWFLAINCIGSVTGPVVAGRAMDLFGQSALFVSGGAALAAVLVGWGISAILARHRASDTVIEPLPIRAAA